MGCGLLVVPAMAPARYIAGTTNTNPSHRSIAHMSQSRNVRSTTNKPVTTSRSRATRKPNVTDVSLNVEHDVTDDPNLSQERSDYPTFNASAQPDSTVDDDLIEVDDESFGGSLYDDDDDDELYDEDVDYTHLSRSEIDERLVDADLPTTGSYAQAVERLEQHRTATQAAQRREGVTLDEVVERLERLEAATPVPGV